MDLVAFVEKMSIKSAVAASLCRRTPNPLLFIPTILLSHDCAICLGAFHSQLACGFP